MYRLCERKTGFLPIDRDFFSHVLNKLGFTVDDALGLYRGRTRKSTNLEGYLECYRMAGHIVEKQLKSEEDLVYSEKGERRNPKTKLRDENEQRVQQEEE